MGEKLVWEVIKGQILGKANHYQAVGGTTGRRIIKDAKIRGYEKSFMQQCAIYRDKQICTPFVLYVKVFNRSQRFDLDNSLKTLLDVLQYVHAIKDDNLCMRIVAEKHLTNNPRVEYAILPINEQKSLFG